METVTDTGFLNHAVWQDRIFTGSWSVPQGGRYSVEEPATGKILTRVGVANAQDVSAAAQTASAAQPAWAAMPPRERAAIFRRAATILQTHFDELAQYVARETGGILPKGQHEVREAIFFLELAAAAAVQATGLILPSVAGRQSHARRVPHGVVGVISPFNFPLVLSIRVVAPALATGNAVIIKPDVQTPVSGGFLIAQALAKAGLPAGVLHVLPGAAEAGEALCQDEAVGMISFTGSTAVGRRVGELASRHLKKVALELGGKNALIVLDDADVDLAVNNAAWGVYLHQGQICMSAGRLLVAESLVDEFTRKLADKARHLPVGNPHTEPVALGPLINTRQRDRVHQLVLDSVEAGAKLEAGGTYQALFYRPTVLSGVKPGMRAFDEEVFGPVANIVSFASDDEAVTLANLGGGSLAAGVISPSVERATAVGNRIKTGMLHINDQTVNDDGINPFGGPGVAGNGSSTGAVSDWDTYTHWQWVTSKDCAPQYPF